MPQDIIDGGTPGSAIDDVIDGGVVGSVIVDIIDGNDGTGTPLPARTPLESRSFWLESLDGSVVVPLTSSTGRSLLPGATGLALPPIDVVMAATPGMPGAWLQEVNELERPIFLPLAFQSRASQADLFSKLAELRSVVASWDQVTIGQEGTFRLHVTSLSGERKIDVVYKSGWDGALGGTDSGSDWEKFGLNVVAVNPFWRSPDPVERLFSLTPGKVFLGDGSGAAPWPRRLAGSAAGGSGVPVFVDGDVEVWPEIEVHGPVTSMTLSYPGTRVSVPGGLPSGSVLTLSTNPRARSARLDGAIAWDRVSFDATFAPLRPGVNSMSLGITGAGDDSALTVRWTPQWKAAW